MISCQRRPQYQAQLQVACASVWKMLNKRQKSASTNASTCNNDTTLSGDDTLFHGPRLQVSPQSDALKQTFTIEQLHSDWKQRLRIIYSQQGFGDSQPFAEDYLYKQCFWYGLDWNTARRKPTVCNRWSLFVTHRCTMVTRMARAERDALARSLQADISLYRKMVV